MCTFGHLGKIPSKTQKHRFVSHWWGEPVKDFIKAVQYHARQRYSPRGALKLTGEYAYKPQHELVGEPEDADATYWICAYANNQHCVGEDIPADPKESSFYKAMQLCEGVLVILDKDATPFTRVWCCFESCSWSFQTHTLKSQLNAEKKKKEKN